jgi:membrane-bound lytic murein transglycosylase D
MQAIIQYSKFLILAVLSCSFLINWYSYETDVLQLTPSSYYMDDGVISSNSIWDAITSDFEIDTKPTSIQVKKEINKILADKEHFNSILQSAAPYLYYIRDQVKSRGLPAELALIPIIESEYNPYDKSNKGASGLWQLMTATAHDLGVKVKSGYDGRRNVISSTKAALAYFKDLGVYFRGNWYLAIAAYNCGQYTVKKAINKTGSESFWNLPLPKENRLYVPWLLAVAEIVKNPDKYGIELPHIEDKPYFAEVNVNKPIKLNSVSEETGINIDTLKKLNPDFTRGSSPDASIQTLLVPMQYMASFKNSFNI